MRRLLIGVGIIFVVIVVGFFILSSSGGIPGRHAAIEASNDDVVGDVHYLASGAYIIYTHDTHDEGYCTKDRVLIDNIRNKIRRRGLYVEIAYRSINVADLPSVGCEPASTDITIYMLTSLCLTEKGAAENLAIEERLGKEHDTYYDTIMCK